MKKPKVRIALTRTVEGNKSKYANFMLYDNEDLIDILPQLKKKVDEMRLTVPNKVVAEPILSGIKKLPYKCKNCSCYFDEIKDKNRPYLCQVCSNLTGI